MEGRTPDLGDAHAPSPLDVFILAGQSNMVGWNEKVWTLAYAQTMKGFHLLLIAFIHTTTP